MRRIILFIALFIPTFQIHARESEQVISGRVVDERNGVGIPGVTIYTTDGRSCTGSNEDGEYRYDMVNGKYTLVSYSFHNIFTDVCHNEYRWKDAPTVQEFQSTGIVQLIGQTDAHDLPEDVFRLEIQKTAFDQIATRYSQYDATFWQGISYPPIPKSMENAVNATLRRLDD